MKFVILLALITSFQAFAQTQTAPAAAPAQDHMAAPAAGESSMAAPEAKHAKKHGKAHHAAKKKHHKKKKHHSAN